MASRTVNAAVNVLTTATLLLGPDIHRKVVWIHNSGTAAIFIGPATVTTATGLPIAPDEKMPLYWTDGDQSVSEAVYAIAAAAQVAPANTRIYSSHAQ